MRNLSIKNKSIIILISIFAVLIAASYAYINALSQNKNNAFADNITYPIHASVKATNFGIVIGADLGNLGGGTFTQTPYNQLPYTALTPSNLYMVFQYTLTTTISKDSVEGTCQDTTENHLSSEANINALKSDLKKFKPSKIVANDTIVETATATWELQSENCVIVSTLRFKPSNHTGYNQDSIDTTTQEFDLYGSQGTEHKVQEIFNTNSEEGLQMILMISTDLSGSNAYEINLSYGTAPTIPLDKTGNQEFEAVIPFTISFNDKFIADALDEEKIAGGAKKQFQNVTFGDTKLLESEITIVDIEDIGDTDFTGVLKINTTRKINFGLNNIQLNPAQVSPSYGQLGFTIDGATNVDSLQANVIIASGLVKVNGPDVPVASAVAPAPDGKSSFNDLGDIQLNSSVIGSGNYKVGADEQVAIYVYSSPVFVGTYSIGSDNTINSVQSKIDDMATLAEIEPGNHTVVIYNDQGQIVSSVATTANAVSSLDGLDAEAEAAALEAARLAKTGAFGGVALAVVVFGLYYYLIRLGRKNGLKAAAK